ncbi:MAG: ATP-binding cassette domain-containing protein [Devosiaceae bacterium]|nr:ATP-binding cassette domain-containing protein [Devosiaceae bacterium]
MISGASGAGKSLFLRAIVDLDVNEGEVFFDDIERNVIAAHIWRSMIAFVPAQTGWWADRVGDHFEQTSLLDDLLLKVGLPLEVFDWQISRLSSGEMQRLGLVRALALKPKFLLLDEPTSALDKKTTKLVEELIKEQLDLGVGIIMISHDDEQVKRLANRSFILENGELKPQQIKRRRKNG